MPKKKFKLRFVCTTCGEVVKRLPSAECRCIQSITRNDDKDMVSRKLFDEHSEYLLMTAPQRRGFRTRCRNLSKRLDPLVDILPLMFLDTIATRGGFDLCV